MNATPLPSDAIFPVRLQQRKRGIFSSRRTDCETLATLECRNVADIRAIDGQEAHLSFVLVECYPKQTRTSGMTMTLSPQHARALSRELWPSDFAALREATAGIAAYIAASGYVPGTCTDEWSPEMRALIALHAKLAHMP